MRRELTSRSSCRRRVRLGLATVALGVTALLASAGSASALSPFVQTSTVHAGDCWITAGAHYDAGRGWAIGAGTVSCSTRHSSMWVHVRLWRWNGTQWTYFSSTDRSVTVYNGSGYSELDTGAVCGGGGTWWITQVDYSIANVGSGSVTNPMQYYSPGAC